MGKRNRFRRQSIRELPLILGPLPLPDTRLFDEAGAGAANGSSGATAEPDESLPVVLDTGDDGVQERVLTRAEGEPLRP